MDDITDVDISNNTIKTTIVFDYLADIKELKECVKVLREEIGVLSEGIGFLKSVFEPPQNTQPKNDITRTSKD